MFEHIIKLLAPHECIHCNTEGSPLCGRCSVYLKPAKMRCYRCHQATSAILFACAACRKKSMLDGLSVVASYEGLAKELIHQLKFKRVAAAAQPIATCIAATISPVSNSLHVAHIPTANRRIRSRGYDQAALIAKEVARITGAPYTPLLARIGSSRQVGQIKEVRNLQMREVFRVSAPAMVEGQTILLIDDVITTGATLEAAALELRRAGALSVRAAAFAAP